MQPARYWGAVSPDTAATPGGRVMPYQLASPAEAVFWYRVGYTLTEYEVDAKTGEATPVRIYDPEASGM